MSSGFRGLEFLGKQTLDTTQIPSLDADKITSGKIDAARLPGPTFTTASPNSVPISFDRDRVITLSATGTVTFTGSSYSEGQSATVRIVPGAASRTLTFPAGWVFVSIKPASIPANKTGILSITSFGTTEANCVAAWALQP